MKNSPFYEREFTCPVCLLKFKSLAVRSSSTYARDMESDFHVMYEGVNPIYYQAIVCPACNYGATINSFKEPLSANMIEGLSKALRLLNKQPVNLCSERSIDDALKAWLIVIQTAQLKKATAGQMAGFFMAVAWLYREKGDIDLERNYLKMALDSYLAAYEHESTPPGNMDQASFVYLIGELNRRLGNVKEAITWFNKVLTDRRIQKNPRIDKLAREQWRIAREQAVNLGDSVEELNQPVSETQSKSALSENNVPFPGENSTETIPSSRAVRHRVKMLMNTHFYSDQIEWMTSLVNRGYETTRTLLTKEQVVRAALDALIECLNVNEIPSNYTSEEQLTQVIRDMLRSSIKS